MNQTNTWKHVIQQKKLLNIETIENSLNSLNNYN